MYIWYDCNIQLIYYFKVQVLTDKLINIVERKMS